MKKRYKSLLGIKLISIKKSINAIDFHDYLGVAKATYSRYLRGDATPGIETLNSLIDKYAKLSGGKLIDMNWLLDEDDKRETPIFIDTVREDSRYSIPFPIDARPTNSVCERPSRGLAAADDSNGTRVPDTDEMGDLVKQPENLIMVPVMGNSMAPKILDGEFVQIDPEREGFEKDGKIYVASILEPHPKDERKEALIGTFIKQVTRHEDMYYFTSINDRSPFSAYVDHCRLWPVLGVWYNDK